MRISICLAVHASSNHLWWVYRRKGLKQGSESVKEAVVLRMRLLGLLVDRHSLFCSVATQVVSQVRVLKRGACKSSLGTNTVGGEIGLLSYLCHSSVSYLKHCHTFFPAFAASHCGLILQFCCEGALFWDILFVHWDGLSLLGYAVNQFAIALSLLQAPHFVFWSAGKPCFQCYSELAGVEAIGLYLYRLHFRSFLINPYS